MTPAEQDAHLAQAQAMLPPGMTADRCRHESITDTSLWIFGTDAKQIGSITHTGSGWWRASQMHRGMPTTCLSYPSLREAMQHITT